jgi:hypothetical protein
MTRSQVTRVQLLVRSLSIADDELLDALMFCQGESQKLVDIVYPAEVAVRSAMNQLSDIVRLGERSGVVG